MSVWTHVSGVLRVDALVIPGRPTPHIPRVLGSPSTYYFLTLGGPDTESKDMPSGSEGSIQSAIVDAGNGLVWKTVGIWGDLRGFDAEDCAQIDAWFARIVASVLMLRAAHLVIETRGTHYM